MEVSEDFAYVDELEAEHSYTLVFTASVIALPKAIGPRVAYPRQGLGGRLRTSSGMSASVSS